MGPDPTSGTVELRSTIDRDWLERRASVEPVQHAYALWDLERYPDRVRFVSAVRGERTLAYLLVWPGPASVPIVHMYGTGEAMEALVPELPSRPLVVIVPPDARERVLAARGVAREYPEWVLWRPRNPSRTGTRERAVRPLRADDQTRLAGWARRQGAPETAEYSALDPEVEPAWGAFDGDRLVGVARAAVRLPQLWVLGGLYVEPNARGKGFGERLVEATICAAESAGAAVGLYVRTDRTRALRLYDRLGFRPVSRRLWLDLDAGLEP